MSSEEFPSRHLHRVRIIHEITKPIEASDFFFYYLFKHSKQKLMAWRSNTAFDFTSARGTQKYEKLQQHLTDSPQRFDKIMVTVIIIIYNNVSTDNRWVCVTISGGGGGGCIAQETFKTEMLATDINQNGKSHLLLSL